MDSSIVRAELYAIAFYTHDSAEMAKQLEAAHRFPDGFRMLTTQAGFALFRGQLMLAKELMAQFASEMISKTGLKGAVAGAWSDLAQGAAIYGDPASARASVRASLDIDRGVTNKLNSAFALAIIGDFAQARALLEEVAHSPEAANEDLRRGVTLAGAILTWRSTGAIDVFPPPKDENDMSGIFSVGIANLEAGHAEIAAQRFKQVVDWKRPSTSPLYALAPLYYGRALAKLGKIDDSRKAYEQFFEQFAHADATLPVLVAARKEFVRLKSPS
jgi:tetratricopeptide (TPR) repeat protein